MRAQRKKNIIQGGEWRLDGGGGKSLDGGEWPILGPDGGGEILDALRSPPIKETPAFTACPNTLA